MVYVYMYVHVYLFCILDGTFDFILITFYFLIQEIVEDCLTIAAVLCSLKGPLNLEYIWTVSF